MYTYLIAIFLGLICSPAAVLSQETQALADLLGFAKNSGSNLDGGADILPPDVAYTFSAIVDTPEKLQLHWGIAKGTYLYKERIHLTLENSPNVELKSIALPPGTVKSDTVRPDGDIGSVEIYHDAIDLSLLLHRLTVNPTQITLIAKYQGCAEQGICYPPITKRVSLNLPAIQLTVPTTAATTVTSTIPASTAVSKPVPAMAESDRLAANLRHDSLWGIVASFFGLGLLLAFTPCIFPMIPILSGIIVGQGQNITSYRAFLLSLVYVLSMAMTYTIAGIAAGLFGQNLQATFQNPWILSSFALLFVALALAMFGLYELQLPTRLQTHVSNISNRQRSGSLLGTAIMGILSALIVGPCVAPPLAGALIYIGQTGDALLGGLALFSMSMGMGVPLLAIGMSAGHFLPKAGIWMGKVKAAFGVLMLGVAIVMLERILPPFVTMLLWGSLLICVSIYMGALQSYHPSELGTWSTLWKGLGVVMLIYGTLMLVGAGAGGHDTLKPLRGILFSSDNTNSANKLAIFQTVKTISELNTVLNKAKVANRPVLIDFYADWCANCKELEQETFTQFDVQRILSNFIRLRVDITANNAADQALLRNFNLTGPPAVLFYDRNGQEQSQLRVIGFMPAAQFATYAEQVIHLQ